MSEMAKLMPLRVASHQSSDWQNNFYELRNQATAGGDGNIVALLTLSFEMEELTRIPWFAVWPNEPGIPERSTQKHRLRKLLRSRWARRWGTDHGPPMHLLYSPVILTISFLLSTWQTQPSRASRDAGGYLACGTKEEESSYVKAQTRSHRTLCDAALPWWERVWMDCRRTKLVRSAGRLR